MQNLNYYELRERSLATQLFEMFPEIGNFNFTEPSTNKSFDGTWTTIDSDVSTFFEVKCRNFPIDKYDEWIVEASKINSLAKWNNKNHPVFIIMFFQNPDNTYDAIIFNINFRIQVWRQQGIEKVIQKKWMNSFTCKSGPKVMKEVIMLKYQESIDKIIKGGKFSYN